MQLVISDTIRAKLHAKHEVSPKDVRECFENRIGGFLTDDREEHRTDPPTLWFIAPNNHNRLLKVCFILRDGTVYLRTCYPPNQTELLIYQTHGSQP
ncbi:MAG: DUF4258 domain-containing protein [Lysobacteraceae bacterium]